MSEVRTSFLIHMDSLNALDDMSDEQAGILFKAIRAYHNGAEMELDFGLKMAFLPFKNQFIRDNIKYQKIVERNRVNGAKNGKNPVGASGSQTSPIKPKKADSGNDSDSVSDRYNKEQFDIFWSKYPNKTGKKAAKAKFLKLPASDIEKIMATIDAFVAHKPFPTYNHPHATTYLNGERWNDEVPADPSAPPPLKQKPADTSSWSEYDHLCWDVSFTPSLLKDYNCARDCLGNTTEAEKRGIYKRFFNQDTLELIDIFIKR